MYVLKKKSDKLLKVLTLDTYYESPSSIAWGEQSKNSKINLF